MTISNAAELVLDEIERAVCSEQSHVVVLTAPGPCTDVLLGAVADRLRPGFCVVRLGAATGKPEDLWAALLRRLGRCEEAATESGVVRALKEHPAETRAIVLLRNADTASPATLAALGRIAAASGLLLVMACEVQDPAPSDPLPALVGSLGQDVRTLRLDAPGQRAAIEQNLLSGPRRTAKRGAGMSGRTMTARSRQAAGAAPTAKRRRVWFPIVSGAAVASLAALLLDPAVFPAQSEPFPERASAPGLAASPQAVGTRTQDTVVVDFVTREIDLAQSRAMRLFASRLRLKASLVKNPGQARQSGRPAVEAARPRPLGLAAQSVFRGRWPSQSLGSLATREVPSRVAVPGDTPVAARAKVPVSINAVPWARIEIDGDVAGVTPIGELPIEPGRHRVRAHFPDGRVIDRHVTLGRGGGHVTFNEPPF